MKATLTTTFTETQLKEIFNSLTTSDCKRVVAFLQKRIQLTEEQQRKKKGGIRKWDDEFLNLSVEEFELHPRIMNRLRENDLHTVKKITELGIDNLTTLRGIGERTAQEIKREIFNNPC
jgi:DNA-directed RNA polymerase alpha subunit